MENKFTNIKERVIQIAEKQEVTKENFFKSIGMTSANFRGKARKTPLNSNAIVNIITKYPDTNLHWLLRGFIKEQDYGEINLVAEEREEYISQVKSSEEKDKIIQLLESQIADLKADKEDLRTLLGLKKD